MIHNFSHTVKSISYACIIQGGAEHLVFPEKGKRAKIFFRKGRFQSQNRATKTTNKGVFGMKEYFGSQIIKED